MKRLHPLAVSMAAVLLTASCTSETINTTTPVDGETFEQWPASAQAWISRGWPIPDDILPHLVTVGRWDYVPGSAIAMAGFGNSDVGHAGMIATIEQSATSGEVKYCLHHYAHGGRIGTTRCALDDAEMAALLPFGIDLSGTCEPPIAQMLTVWEIPESSIAFVVDLDDGHRSIVTQQNGVAIVAWEGERSIASVRFDGDTPEQIAQLSSLSTERARISCPAGSGVPESATPPPGSLGGATAPEDVTPITAGSFVSPSLEEVKDLRPNEWPWFSDRVPVPLHAIAGGSDFVEILYQVPALNGFTILSAERPTHDGADLQWRSAWLKVSDYELLEIRSSLFKPEATAVWYPPPGIRESDWQPGLIYVNLIIGNRFVGMNARVTNLDEDVLSLTTDELFAIAEEIILLYEIQP